MPLCFKYIFLYWRLLRKNIYFLSAFLIISTPVFSASNSEETNKNIKKVVFENALITRGLGKNIILKTIS